MNRKFFPATLTVFLFLCLSNAALSQVSSCVPKDTFQKNQQKLIELYTSFQAHAKQKIDLSGTRLQLLKTINECQDQTSLFSDLVDVISLSDAKCNKEIREYNMTLAQEQSIQSMIDMESTLLPIYANSVKQAQGNVCQ